MPCRVRNGQRVRPSGEATEGDGEGGRDHGGAEVKVAVGGGQGEYGEATEGDGEGGRDLDGVEVKVIVGGGQGECGKATGGEGEGSGGLDKYCLEGR